MKQFTGFFKKIQWQTVALVLLLLIASFLRFYNAPYRYSLGEETVRDAVIGLEGAREFQFPLTGSFSSLGPFTFGPWYAYQLIFFAIFVPHVYSPWIYLSLLSIAYIFVMYRIGKLLVNNTFGLVLAYLATFSPVLVISATHLTSHNMTNFIAITVIWLFIKILKQRISHWWGFLLGFVLGMGINFHFQMAGLGVVFLLILIADPKKYRHVLAGAFGILMSFLPYLFFEANNHWFNTKNIVYYLLYGKNAIYVPNRWLFYVRDFWPSYWADVLGIPVWVTVVLIVSFLCIIGWSLYKKSLQRRWHFYSSHSFVAFFCYGIIGEIVFLVILIFYDPSYLYFQFTQ